MRPAGLAGRAVVALGLAPLVIGGLGAALGATACRDPSGACAIAPRMAAALALAPLAIPLVLLGLGLILMARVPPR